MTQTTNKIFDDIAKLMTNAAGAAQGVRREIDTVVKSQAERVLNELEVVTRDEFDAVQAMAVKAREENEVLKAQIEALEARIAALEATPKKAPAKRTATKKAPRAASTRKKAASSD